MSNKCLYCYKPYTLDQMADLAKNVVERSIAVPGVQPKISLSLIHNALTDGGNGHLTVVGALGGNYIFKQLRREHFEGLGKGLDLTDKQISGVFKRFVRNRPVAEEWVKKSFLSEDQKERYVNLLGERYGRLPE